MWAYALCKLTKMSHAPVDCNGNSQRIHVNKTLDGVKVACVYANVMGLMFVDVCRGSGDLPPIMGPRWRTMICSICLEQIDSEINIIYV